MVSEFSLFWRERSVSKHLPVVAPEEGGLFSLFGDTNEDEDAKDSLFTTVEPTSFKLFPDPEPERMAVDDTPNVG